MDVEEVEEVEGQGQEDGEEDQGQEVVPEFLAVQSSSIGDLTLSFCHSDQNDKALA